MYLLKSCSTDLTFCLLCRAASMYSSVWLVRLYTPPLSLWPHMLGIFQGSIYIFPVFDWLHLFHVVFSVFTGRYLCQYKCMAGDIVHACVTCRVFCVCRVVSTCLTGDTVHTSWSTYLTGYTVHACVTWHVFCVCRAVSTCSKCLTGTVPRLPWWPLLSWSVLCWGGSMVSLIASHSLIKWHRMPI